MSGPNVFNLDVLRQSIAQLEEFKSGQMKKIREDQVQNSAGGFVFEVSDDIRVRRFIILGTTGGSYYATEKELTMENVAAIIEIIKKGKGALVLQEILNISLAGRAPKQETTLFALALCAKASYFKRTDLGDAENLQYEKYLEMLKKTAASIVPKVCRIPTHLFGYVNYCEMIAKSVAKKSGWGRQMRRTIAEWYLNQEPKALAMHITKYPQRNGWSHADLLRLSHPNVSKKSDDALLYDHLLSFAVHGKLDLGKNNTNYTPPSKKKREYNVVPEKAQEVVQHESIKFLQNFLILKKLTTQKDDVKKCTDFIREYGYVREHIPSNLLNCAVVWKTLLENMPMTAFIRNLSKLSSLQIIDGSNNDNRKYVDLVISKITDEAALKKAKIHPLNVLTAAVQYRAGCGLKGKLKWFFNGSISKALDDAFYKSFHNVEPTNKRFLLAFDVSGSMNSPIAGSQISCREASAALGMVAMRTEPIAETMCFHTKGFVPLDIKKDQSLPQIMNTMKRLPFGRTDCAQPMLWALENKKEFDVFIVYTDSETWYGDIHPFEAMKKYRKEMNIPDAKLIVMGMAANNFTIADPSDPNMLDVVGFDSGVPEVIRGFVLGEI
uniref:TROVE domain-containing protein n=1 Tax=Panagrolaimus davidi TaxID=227884 RepID=A0A914P5A3_9BILA